MWYFIWILGLTMASLFTAMNALWHEGDFSQKP